MIWSAPPGLSPYLDHFCFVINLHLPCCTGSNQCGQRLERGRRIGRILSHRGWHVVKRFIKNVIENENENIQYSYTQWWNMDCRTTWQHDDDLRVTSCGAPPAAGQDVKVAETHAYLSKHPMRSRRMIKDQAEYGSNKLLVVVDRIIILSLAT